MKAKIAPSSFRDPSGFVFRQDGVLYRQVNRIYSEHYDRLMASGLYGRLADLGLLVSHEEVLSPSPPAPAEAYLVLRPRTIEFISYPYEWSFSQLKDTALATLNVQQEALERGLTLKDASAFNIQFLQGKPVLIDTLSFETYEEDSPWVAYKQFCQHFLAPLALTAYRDVRLMALSKNYIDGIPLDLAAMLLPRKSYLSLGISLHIHLHAKKQASYSDKVVNVAKQRVRKRGLLGIIDNLEATIRRLKWRPAGTEWADYYSETNYSDEATNRKKEIVSAFVREIQPQRVWDLGANTGLYSRIACDEGAEVVAFDIDPAAVERHYLLNAKQGIGSVLPLVLDLTNPSPAIGWHNQERESLLQRGPADMILALALIHHLAISNNTPLASISKLFQQLGGSLLIEFVPKEDPQVARLLATRRDVFPGYRQETFEEIFSRDFTILHKEKVADSQRTLYLMKNKNPPHKHPRPLND